VERKLIQESEEESKQKLEVGDNRGHSPGSSQHSLDKHIPFEEAQLPATNKGFITPSRYYQPAVYFISPAFSYSLGHNSAFSSVTIDHYTRYTIILYLPDIVLSFSTIAYIYEVTH